MENGCNGSTAQERAYVVRERYIALRAQFVEHHAECADAARFSLGDEYREKQRAAERYAQSIRNYTRTIEELTREFELAPVELSEHSQHSRFERQLDFERPR